MRAKVWQPIVSGTPRAFDFMARHGIKGAILGTATEYVDRWIHQYQEANARYGAAQFKEQLTRFAQDVMPAFQSQSVKVGG
jgi:CRISPR/Cas system-associated endonuclease Cas1